MISQNNFRDLLNLAGKESFSTFNNKMDGFVIGFPSRSNID